MLDIEIAKNAAANGRLFNVLSFVLVLAIGQHNTAGLYVAIFPILSLGAAYLGDTYKSQPFGALSIIAAIVPLVAIPFMGV